MSENPTVYDATSNVTKMPKPGEHLNIKKDDIQPDLPREFRLFLQLAYSLARQFVSWYEKEIKK